METWLHVAEKPSVAREITSVLAQQSKTSTLRSFSQYNPVVQFEIPNPSKRGSKNVLMIVTSVVGHLMEDQYDDSVKKISWNNFPLPDLFTRPIIKTVRVDMKDTVQKNLEFYARRAKKLVCWLDCDREGENIAFEVIKVCTEANSYISCLRARFSGLSSRDVWHAVSNLVEPNKCLSDAADARAELDLRVGAAFTRFQTLLFRSHFSSERTGLTTSAESKSTPKVLSYGTCQFPTLGFVVKRFKEKENFVSEDYYKISLEYHGFTFHWKRGVVYDKISTYALFVNCVEQVSKPPENEVETDSFERFKSRLKEVKAKVSKVDARNTMKSRPVPLCTVELQKLASRFLRLTSEKCMTLAESLYQEGYISYPRTETTFFNLPEQGIRELVGIQEACEEHRIQKYATELLKNSKGPDCPEEVYFCIPRKGNRDDGAHPPIHPLKPFQKFPDTQKTQLFELICIHFLATCSDDALGHETIITAAVGDEEFTCRGLMIKSMNWLSIFRFEKWSDRVIPNMPVGLDFSPSIFDVIEGKTYPPQNLSEVELIELMDKHGIGTDATIATHIKTIQDREYVTMKNENDTDDEDEQAMRMRTIGRFTPTKLGLAFNHVYDKLELHEPLFQPRVRAKLEKDLSLVASAKKSKDDVIQASLAEYKSIFMNLFRRQGAFVDALAMYFEKMEHPIEIKALGIGNISGSLYIRKCARCSGGLHLGQSSRDNANFLRCDSCPYYISLPPWKIEITHEREGSNAEWCTRCHPRSRMVNIDFCANGITAPPMGMDQIEKLCFWCSPEMTPYMTYSKNTGR